MEYHTINKAYSELIEDLADRANTCHQENPETDRSECVNIALDEGLMYYSDQLIVIAHYFINGNWSWYQPLDWDTLSDELYSDVYSKLAELWEEGEE